MLVNLHLGLTSERSTTPLQWTMYDAVETKQQSLPALIGLRITVVLIGEQESYAKGWAKSPILSLFHVILINCRTRQSLLLFIGSLHWLSSWQWWPPMRGCRLYLPPWRPKMGDLSQLFRTNYMSPDGEFRRCHLVFGVFCPQIHVFSEIREHGGNTMCWERKTAVR